MPTDPPRTGQGNSDEHEDPGDSTPGQEGKRSGTRTPPRRSARAPARQGFRWPGCRACGPVASRRESDR